MRFWLLLILICGIGCGDSAKKGEAFADSKDSLRRNRKGWASEAESQFESAVLSDDTAASDRKIIYTASMVVVVENFDQMEQKIDSLVKSHGGFISSANLDRMRGERRSGNWTVRIPVDQYDKFLNAVGNIGVPTSRNQTASDVTEEFVDLEARIKNKKNLETRILQLLEQRDDEIKNVLSVERELNRVREEIERMEGRLRYLTDRTSLTTVEINIREEQEYVPPQAPTLANRVSSAWSSSLLNCRRFLEDLVVLVVGNFIGFIAFLIGLVIAWFIFRRVLRMMTRKTTTDDSA